MNKPIQYAIIYAMHKYGFESQMSDVSFKDYTLTIKDMKLHNDVTELTIKDFQFRLTEPDRSFKIIKAKISAPQITIHDKTNKEPIFRAILDLDYKKSLFESGADILLSLSNIKTNIDNLPTGSLTYASNIDKSQSKSTFALDFGPESNVIIEEKYATQNKQSEKSISVKNIPIILYKIAYHLNPHDSSLAFLNNLVKSGNIVSGKALISSQTNGKMVGEFSLADIDLKYDENYPTIQKANFDILINDLDIKLNIKRAYSSNILISDGTINTKWKGIDDTVLFLKAKGEGPAKDLTDFVASSTMASLKLANIDLSQITGITYADIEVEIPLLPGSANKYNISAELPNSSLGIFKNEINIELAKLKGKFTGDHLLISGKSKINGFASKLDFVYNTKDESNFQHKLNIKTKISQKDNHKLSFITLFDGDADLDFEYSSRGSKGYLKATSNLKNLDLYFDKLGIRKRKGETAKFEMEGALDDPTHYNINFKTIGANHLDIQGEIRIDDDITTVKIPTIRHNQTKLNASITSSAKLLQASLRGNILDLSDADMLSFLKKERSSGSTKLDIDVGNVKLKKNIELDNLKLKFECDKMRCFAGSMSSKIGTKDVSLQLSAIGEKEEWKIACDNAGALLKGIGAYDSMKAGNLSILIHTSRKEVKPGEIIPIYEGSFTFKKFVIQDAKTIARLISVVSLPGFISTISGNKDISFSKMNGKFSFDHDILSVLNSTATGPYFDFTMHGTLNLESKKMNLKGHVNPALYGVTKLIGSVPLFGKIFTGNKNHRGVFSAPYHIKDSF